MSHEETELLAGRYEIAERAYGASAAESYGSMAGEPGATYHTVTIATPSGRGACAALGGKRFTSRGSAQGAVDRELGYLRAEA